MVRQTIPGAEANVTFFALIGLLPTPSLVVLEQGEVVIHDLLNDATATTIAASSGFLGGQRNPV